jgi:DNA modification methylase
MSFRREQIGNATLYLGDCLEVLPTLEGVDAVVTDPPYGIGETNERNLSRGKAAAPRDYGDFEWDSEPCSPEMIATVRSISRHQVIFGGNYFDLPPTSCWLVWDKQNTGDFADCELAWTNLPKAVRRIYWRWNGMIRKGHEERYHPTQKPVGVIEWCIGQLPKDAHTICDPFMGSGTTGVACAKLGRKFIGIEIEEKYFEIACRRIEDAYKQPDMFVEPPKKATQDAML